MSRRTRAASLVLAAFFLVAAPVAADAWRRIPGASPLARPGAPRVRLEVRASGGFGCGGGGCNGGVETRNVRGELPSPELSYFYSDRPGAEPGCPASRSDSLFESWTEVEIAPSRGGEDHRLSCGIGMMVGSTFEEWVILRVRRVRRPG